MDVIELFESPLPELAADTDKISVETSGNHEGSFIIRNTGGGELMGNILSNSSVLKFSPDSFCAKRVTVFYTLDITSFKPGDIIKTSVVIMSNGGEKIIPVVIKILPFCIETKENIKITSLKDFYRYAKKHPLSARQMFMSHDFSVWLLGISYPNMAIYEKFLEDPNKERGLDNFLILNKFKRQAEAEPDDKSLTLNIAVNPYTGAVQTGNLTFKRQSWGYLNTPLVKDTGAAWLTLEKDALSSQDFDENHEARVAYSVQASLIPGNTAFEKIIAGNKEIAVYVKKTPPLSAKLSRESFRANERGYITITNNTGNDLTVDVAASESVVRMESARFLMSSFVKIPFDIKLTSIQTAQYLIRRKPYIPVSIFVSNGEHAVRKKLDITVEL